MPELGGIVLAAGGSSRLGRPKQLLVYRGQTLVHRAARAMIDAGCDPAVVVLGAEADHIAAELHELPVQVVVNPHWTRGIGSSVKAGAAAAISARPSITTIVLLPCDQPLITAVTLKKLVRAHREAGASLSVCDAGGVLGPPVVIDRSQFDQLMAIEDAEGLRQLWKTGRPDVLRFPSADGFRDIDTEADYQSLLADE